MARCLIFGIELKDLLQKDDRSNEKKEAAGIIEFENRFVGRIHFILVFAE